MNFEDLEHILRAAGEITGESTFFLFGSQAILATDAKPDARLLVSAELDICPGSDSQEMRDRIDGAIGELSKFHETHQIYAHSVDMRTAKLPRGWRERWAVVMTPGTNGVTGYAPSPTDLVAAKLVRGEDKDCEFARAAIESGIVEPDDLIRLTHEIEGIPPAVKARVIALATGLVASIDRTTGPSP